MRDSNYTSNYTMDRGEWRIPSGGGLEQRRTRFAFRWQGSRVEISEWRVPSSLGIDTASVEIYIANSEEAPTITTKNGDVELSLGMRVCMSTEQAQAVARLIVNKVGVGE